MKSHNNLKLNRRSVAAGLALGGLAPALWAQQSDPIKIGVLLPITGPFSYMGRQVMAGVNLYLAENGSTVAGRRIELLVKDDEGKPDSNKRIAQELLVSEKVTALAGFGLTPQALATAPLATQAKTPMVVMQAAGSVVTEKSPYVVRTSMTLPQVTQGLADWAVKNHIGKVVSLVSDYAPGIDAERTFNTRFTALKGQVLAQLRMPVVNSDFAPYLQRVLDLKPEAVFVFLPAGSAAAIFMKQYAERALSKAGIRLIGPGDITDDDVLGDMGDEALGTITSHHYSAAHPGAVNKKFVAGIMAANKGMRPSFMAVAGYDGMHVIMEGLKATQGQGGEALINAMKGMAFESPRGPIQIDPQTRDIVQNVYIRKVERVGGKLFNIEIDTLPMVKDPDKAG